MKLATKAIHIGEEPNLKPGGTGDAAIPIHLSTTFARKKVAIPTGGYVYSRSGNPTRTALEKRLAALENAKYGLAFASGLAAETVLLLSFLKTGDHVVAADDLYGGTKRLFNAIFTPQFGVEFTYVDARAATNVSKALKPTTKIIWMESPTNPLMKLCDVSAIAQIAKKSTALLVVDNTFMSPYFQQPLSFGADIALHSTTKYLGGHNDSIGGALMLNNPKLYEKLAYNQNATGAILSPFECYTVIRGIKTLGIRMERHDQNARSIAKFLAKHPKISKVYYPGLPNNPQYQLAKKQMTGFGGMISFEVKGNLGATKKFLEALKIFTLGESLGSVRSLIEHPALMTHASVAPTERLKIGITDSLVRMSVGIEDIEDLTADLTQALKKV